MAQQSSTSLIAVAKPNLEAIIHVAHKVEISPTDIQKDYLNQSMGVARFAYNWALGRWGEMFQTWRDFEEKKAEGQENPHKKPSHFLLSKELNAIKAERYPWMLEVSKCCPQVGIKNLGAAFKRFFSKDSKARYPQFKKKGVNDSFTLDNCQFSLTKDFSRILVPCPRDCKTITKAHRAIRMREQFRFPLGRLLSATFSKSGGRFFVSIACEMPLAAKLGKEGIAALDKSQSHVVGIDLGIKDIAILSDGTRFQSPKALATYERKLKRLQRCLSRKKKGGKNRDKLRQKVNKLHYRIACIRKDAAHKLTTFLAKTYSFIAIEDLNVAGMVLYHKLAKAISDIALGEVTRQLLYKAAWYGCTVVQVNRWFPSSQLCSHCAYKNTEVKNLSVRSWTCPECDTSHDRDLNAAHNILSEGLKTYLGGEFPRQRAA